MGCDIHCHIEYKDSSREGSSWWSFGGQIHLDRSYTTFGKLAGVRKGVTRVPPRGMPEDPSWETLEDDCIYVTDSPEEAEHNEKSTSRATAERWVASGSSKWLTEPDAKFPKVSHPDWHTHSWLDLDEWKAATADAPDRYQVVTAALEAFVARGYQVRVVFWFDN